MRPALINDNELRALSRQGTAWQRATSVASGSWGTPNLGLLDSLHQTRTLTGALVWRANMLAGQPDAALRNKVAQAVTAAFGTEGQAGQPLNPYRQLPAYLMAASAIEMRGDEKCSNGESLDAYIASLPTRKMPEGSNPDWDTATKCSTATGNNWAAFAWPTLLGAGLWSNNQTAIALATRCIRRALGDLSVPNTFAPTSGFRKNPSWAVRPYPSEQGVISPRVADPRKNGSNVEDAARGGVYPNLSGDALHYCPEWMDGVTGALAMLYNDGQTDVWEWGDQALQRNVEWFRYCGGWDKAGHQFWGLVPVYQHLFDAAIPDRTLDGYSRRVIPNCTDWLVSGGTWLKGGAVEPVQPEPIEPEPVQPEPVQPGPNRLTIEGRDLVITVDGSRVWPAQ